MHANLAAHKHTLYSGQNTSTEKVTRASKQTEETIAT